MAKASKKPKDKSAKKKGGKSTFMLILVTLVGLAVARYAAIILIVGIFPSVVANMVDRTPKKAIFHTVFACNLAGVLPYVGELMALGNNWTAVESKVFDIYVWCTMYIAAAMGWVLILAAPRIMDLVLSAAYSQKVNSLNAEQKKLVDDWGPEVRRKELEGA